MKKRMLAMMMAIVMVMTLLPTSALAAGGDTGLQEGQVRATKALVLDKENQPVKDADGYYTVQITVQGKPTQAENGSNADVVLVVDNSGSMDSSVGEPCNTPKEQFEEQDMIVWKSYTCPNCGAEYSKTLLWDTRPEYCTGQKGETPRIDAAKAVGKEFANSILAAGTGNQLAVIGFAHNKDRGGVDEKALTVSQDLTTDKNLIDTKIDQMKADGGTNYTAALAKAQEYLNNRSDKTRPGYVIFISDGAPGLSGDSLNDSKWNGSAQIQQLKADSITVYTVGIALGTDAANYLKSMASDNQDEHFINVSTVNYKDEMSKILQTWATKINSIPAGRNATITDVVNTDEFDYKMVGTPSNVTNANGTVTWNIGDITEEPQSIQFKVKPKDGKYGTLYTNESVELSYTNCDGEKKQIKDTKKTAKPQIGDPYIEIANPARAYTVEYYYNGKKGAVPAGAPTSGTANVGDTVTISAGDNADATHFPKKTTVDTENYAFDEGAANVLNTTIVEDATKNVLKVYYAKDENKDGIPDKYQALVKFESADATKGTVAGEGAVQVFTFKDTDGKYLTSGNVTPSLDNVTTTPATGFVFDYWTKDNGTEPVDPATIIKDVPGGTTITFKANWKSNVVTITFDANGGAWAAAVDGYTMNADKTTASKKFNLSDTVEKITPDPVQDGKKFSGWGVKLDENGKPSDKPSDKIVAYPLLETSATAAAHKRIFDEKPIIFYAMWEDAAQPTEKLNYTTRQHYIDEKGNEVATVDVGGVDLLALQGTKISKLIQHLEKDQNYFGQKYLYDRTKTTVNGDAYNAETMTLDTDGKAIDLYYYLDEWNDENDKVTGGDGTPDKYQALVKFESADATKGAVTGTGAVQVFTFKNAEGEYLTSGNVTPSLANVTTTPADGFAFDIWTKDKDVDSVNPEATMESVPGGTTITFKAHFAADKIGSENKPDNIPDKYQAVVTYKVVGGTWKDGKTDAQVQVFTLKTKNADGAWVEATPAPVLGDTIPTGMISSYSRTASQSWDKDITKDTKVTESVTYTYTFTKGSSGGGGSSSTHYYISLKKVDAQDGEALSGAKFGLYLDGKQIATATSDRNGIVRFSMGSSNYRSLTDKSNLYCQELTAPEGYKLSNEKIAVSKKNVSTSSSTSDKNAKTVKNSRSKTPSMLNGEDHFAYIVGYPDKTVHPQSSITRAEVATIFFRLLTEETRTANATKTNKYADVSSDKWYNQAVSTLSAMGIIKGDSRGNFNPNAPITRAEFAAIAARFDKTEDVAAASFGDVATHWAKPEISVAANNGWINGYTDGTFHPDSKITRAEAMAMINRVLQRLPESKADLLDGMIQWSDNADTSKWYYLAVQEATNSHYYELKANQHEKWTKLRENRDWTELEK